MARLPLATVLVLAAGCTTPARPTPPAPSPVRTEAPAREVTPAPAPSTAAAVAAHAVAPLASVAPSASATSPLPPGPPFPEQPRATPGPGEVAIEDASTGVTDLPAWLAAHHVPATVSAALHLLDRGCSTVALAGSKGELLGCRDGGMDGECCFDRLEIFAVESGSLRAVFTQNVSVISTCDEPGRWLHRVQVSVWVKDGRELVVREDGGSCHPLPAGASPFSTRIAAMCRAAGRYTWSGSRFARVGPPP